MAKIEITAMTSAMMPNGNPSFLEVVQYPTIKQLTAAYGHQDMIKVLFLMVKDLSSSINVVRNMNEDQMIEAAAMLLDECDNFRLEDYQMMFALAKRGSLIKIMDRLDINIISLMMDEYYTRRRMAGERYYEEHEADNIPEQLPPSTPVAIEAENYFGKLAGVMKAWQEEDEQTEQEKEAESRRKLAEEYAKLHNVNFEEILKNGPHWREVEKKTKREHSLNKHK